MISAIPIVGIVLGVALIAQCLAIIPVTSAPAMIAYGAGGFTTRDMIRLGIPLAVVMYALIVACMFTYGRSSGFGNRCPSPCFRIGQMASRETTDALATTL